jgi:hypothetical protein
MHIVPANLRRQMLCPFANVGSVCAGDKKPRDGDRQEKGSHRCSSRLKY